MDGLIFVVTSSGEEGSHITKTIMCGQYNPREPVPFTQKIIDDVEPKYPPLFLPLTLVSGSLIKMAVTLSVQSLLASPVSRVTNRSCLVGSQLFPVKYGPRLQRHGCISVRCSAEDGDVNEKSTTTPPVPPLESRPRPTPVAPKVSTKFSDVLAFSGPAPERINGRLAMIGFVSAMAVEIANGQDVFAQISNGGIPWFVGTSVVLSLASLIPLFKGVSVESRSEGFMTSDAELWNGRFAMMGLLALAFTEYLKGGTLV